MTRDIFKVFGTNIVRMVVAVFATFLLPTVLDISNYGNVKLYQLYISYIGLLHFGYCDGVYLKYGGDDLEKKQQGIKTDLYTFEIFQLITACVIILVGICKKDFLICVFGATVFPRNTRSLLEYVFQATGNFGEYSKIVNGYSLLTIVGYSILILLFHIQDFRVYVLTFCFVDILTGWWAKHILKKRIALEQPRRMSCKVLYQNIRMGIFLMIGNFANTFLLNIDKWFVKGYLGMEAFAYYSFATQILLLISMFITPVTMTLYSYFSKYKSLEFEKKINNHLIPASLLILCLPFGVEAVVIKWLPSYWQSIELIYILFVSQLIMAINTAMFVNLFKTYKKQKTYLRNLCLTILGSCLLNYMFYKYRPEISSFAYATLASMMILIFLNVQEFKYIKMNIKNVLFCMINIITYFLLKSYVNPYWGFGVYLVTYMLSFFCIQREEMEFWKTKLLREKIFHGKK